MENWHDAAACKGESPALFFPEPGFSAKEALDICASCIVSAQCLDEGLRRDELGVWGGTTKQDRKRIKRQWIRGSKALDGATRAV